MKSDLNILLVGYGRMGARYARVLENHFGDNIARLVTVDHKEKPILDWTDHYESLDQVPDDYEFDLAIDAHPNIDRSLVLDNFLKRKVPYLVIEKPHAMSWEESLSMEKAVATASKTAGYTPSIMMPFYERYGPHYSKETLSQLNAGNLKGIHIAAGAIGLGCNGVHFIDLANFLFEGLPMEVMASLQIGSITSPRGTRYMDDGGTVVANYSHGRQFTLSIQSESAAGIHITLLYERGKVQIVEQIDPLWFWYQQEAEHHEFPYYRTHLEKPLTPPVGYDKDLENLMMPNAIRDLLTNKPTPNFQDGVNSLRMIAMAYASTYQKRTVAWDDEAAIAPITFKFT